MEGLSHVHVTTKPRDIAAPWLTEHTGGALTLAAPNPRSENILDRSLNLFQVQSGAPLQQELDGSAWITSVGIAVSDLGSTLVGWARGGGAVLSQRSQCGVVECASCVDPWGVSYELVQSGSPGLSHVNIAAHDPEELLRWYETHLGGETGGARPSWLAAGVVALRFPQTGLRLCFCQAAPGSSPPDAPTDTANRKTGREYTYPRWLLV